jgi:hypothetical protein
MTVRLKVPANVYDAFKEAAKLARELNRRWAPEEAAAKWLGQQAIAALQELRAEMARRESRKPESGSAQPQRDGDRPRSQAG